jgi:DNA-binding GntR family transcriptional regulator
MSQTRTAKTLVEDVYARIRTDILGGRLQAGQRLKLALLCKEHAVSLSIVREALTRLAAEKLVRAKPQQGFAVIGLSVDELRDMTVARIAVESVALRRSIERGDLEWEGRLLAAHHRLANTPVRAVDNPSRLSAAFTEAHAAFHATLIDACASPTLIDICRSLYDGSELYRRLTYALNRGRRTKAVEHRALMEAALARKADLAVNLLAKHFEQTTATLIELAMLEKVDTRAA